MRCPRTIKPEGVLYFAVIVVCNRLSIAFSGFKD
jgi:hypothetical protein